MSIDANSIASAGLRGSSDNYLFSELETGHGEYFSGNKLVIPEIAGVIDKGILVSRNGATTNLQLDLASETKLGGIKIGTGLQIDGTGTASGKVSKPVLMVLGEGRSSHIEKYCQISIESLILE